MRRQWKAQVKEEQSNSQAKVKQILCTYTLPKAVVLRNSKGTVLKE